jgi:hypothetical protein
MTDTDHPELVKFEGETLGDTLTNLLTEVKRLREQNEYFRGLLDHYKGELIDEHAEVKRLRERVHLAERYIIEPTLTRNYFADVVSKGLDNERDNLG